MSQNQETKASQASFISARHLTACAAAIAISYALSCIKFLQMPWGGSVTPCSMLFICLIGYWYGPATGITTGFAYGFLQMFQDGLQYILNPFQACTDYLFAFASLGLAGVFRKHGASDRFIPGYLFAVFVRGLFHALGGYLFWMSYMPENFPKKLAVIYPFAYNYSFLAVEAVLTVIVISLPPVVKALKQIGRTVA